MKARPILFSTPMIKALLDGRKTQTRRVVKPQPLDFTGRRWVVPNDSPKAWHDSDDFAALCPYGRPGDLLWARETWCSSEAGEPIFRACKDKGLATLTEFARQRYGERWRPSTRMPRWASRLTLEITGVRVERLQDINETNAIAEGATSRPNCSGFRNTYSGWSMDWSMVGTPSRFGTNGTLTESDISLGSAKLAFGAFINELHGGKCWNRNGKQPLWDANPWVWVLSFKVHRCNVDELLKARVA